MKPAPEMSSFSVMFVDGEQHVPPGLWDACEPRALEGRWWYRALERAGLEDQFRFLYAVVHDGGEPIGLAPCFTMRLPLDVVLPDGLAAIFTRIGLHKSKLLRPKALFVGSPCSDEGWIGVVPGVDRTAAIAAVQAALQKRQRDERADLLIWKDMPPGLTADLARLAGHTRLFPVVSYPGTRVGLPATKAAYYEQLSSSRRQRFKRRLRRSREQLPLETHVVQHPDEATLHELFALFWDVYVNGRTKFEELNIAVFRELAALDHSHFLMLREPGGGKPVAFMLCFRIGGEVINKFIGLDCARPRGLHLNERLLDAAIDWCIETGAHTLQSGQTGYATKLMAGHQLIPLTNFCQHRNAFFHAVFKAVGRRIDWASLDDDLKAALEAHPELRKGMVPAPA